MRITKPYYLGVYEVTQGEYERVMGTNPSYFSRTGSGSDKVSGQDTSRFPVERVSREGTPEFCRKLSALPAEESSGQAYRLPTEAEWEYACRAGSTTMYSFEATSDQLGEYALFSNNSVSPWRVGSRRPNAFGLYDMHGNVWEWCQDWFDDRYYVRSPLDDPSGASGGSDRVIRGGGWGAVPRTAGRPSATGAGRRAGTTSWASASRGPFPSLTVFRR